MLVEFTLPDGGRPVLIDTGSIHHIMPNGQNTTIAYRDTYDNSAREITVLESHAEVLNKIAKADGRPVL